MADFAELASGSSADATAFCKAMSSALRDGGHTPMDEAEKQLLAAALVQLARPRAQQQSVSRPASPGRGIGLSRPASPMFGAE
jgi:hypothetical protein